jgi:hypothetical protein
MCSTPHLKKSNLVWMLTFYLRKTYLFQQIFFKMSSLKIMAFAIYIYISVNQQLVQVTCFGYIQKLSQDYLQN